MSPEHSVENDACPQWCLNRLAPQCVIHRPAAEKDVPANYLAPDGYRYGVMFNDGSVGEWFNGSTQRERAEDYARATVADQIARVGRHDHITAARHRLGEPWQRVIPPGTSDIDLDDYADLYDRQDGIETTVIPPGVTEGEAISEEAERPPE